jgi:hypothetical protein
VLREEQDTALARLAYEQTSAVLIEGEEIEYIATGLKGGVAHHAGCAVATNKRLLVYKKKLLGKIEFDDCFWRDVQDVQMKDGRHGLSLVIDTIQGWHVTVDALPRAQASRLHQLAYDHAEKISGKAAQQAPGDETSASPGQITQPITSTQLAANHPEVLSGALYPATRQESVPVPLRSPSASGPLKSGPLGPPREAPIQAPSHQEVLLSLLRSSREASSQPLTHAAAFHAPPQTEAKEIVFEERTSQSLVGVRAYVPSYQSATPSGPLQTRLAGAAGGSAPLKPAGEVAPADPPRSQAQEPTAEVAKNNSNGSVPNGIRPPGATPSPVPRAVALSDPIPHSPEDPVRKMKQLKEMLDSGLITSEDYESKKAEILARI